MQLREGLIEEGSAAWEAMSAADRAKRKRAAGEARTKLNSPNFFLSRTRLCLRNLPPSMSEKALKELVLAAVRVSPKTMSVYSLGRRALPCSPWLSQAVLLYDESVLSPSLLWSKMWLAKGLLCSGSQLHDR